MTNQVLHADFVSLKPETTAEQREQVIAAAAALGEMPGVLRAAVIEADEGSDYELAFFFLLPHFIAIEPFGTDTRYVRFLQKSVAPHLRSFAGADVKLDDDMPAGAPSAACLALALPDETYDWEVRERLQAWSSGAPATALGIAAGDRQRYRGLVVVFGETPTAKESLEAGSATLISGRWRELG